MKHAYFVSYALLFFFFAFIALDNISWKWNMNLKWRDGNVFFGNIFKHARRHALSTIFFCADLSCLAIYLVYLQIQRKIKTIVQIHRIRFSVNASNISGAIPSRKWLACNISGAIPPRKWLDVATAYWQRYNWFDVRF